MNLPRGPQQTMLMLSTKNQYDKLPQKIRPAPQGRPDFLFALREAAAEKRQDRALDGFQQQIGDQHVAGQAD